MKRKVRGKLALEYLKTCLGTVAVFNREVKHRDKYILETYRAGRATQMAARGFSFGENVSLLLHEH